MTTKNLRQSVLVPAAPHAVYETLLDAKRHAKLIGADARIVRKPGGSFSMWGAMISGFTLELQKDRRIVQAWRGGDWPKHHYSCATYELKRARGGTRLTFTQTGIPSARFKGITQGWKDYYWTPLVSSFKKR